MGKKKFNYKNLKVDETDLSVTKIGEMPNEDKSPIFLIFIFGIMIAFIFFLPDIVKYYNKDDNTINNSSSNESGKDKQDDVEEQELVYYDLNSSLTVNLEENIKINNFKINNNTLFFTVMNESSNKFYFSKKNYFLELYTNDKTLLERVILNKDSIEGKGSKDYSYSIKSNNAQKIVFVEKQEDDYPNITLKENEDKEQFLVCKNTYEEITYKFKYDKLRTINDVINYNRNGNETDYQNMLSIWQKRVNDYNNIEGVTSTLMSNTTGFGVTTILDLENVKVSKLENENYYNYETMPKVVSFEMQARGFSCN